MSTSQDEAVWQHITVFTCRHPGKGCLDTKLTRSPPFHHSLHLPLMSSLTSASSSPSSRLSCVLKPTLAWTRCVIGNLRASPALPLNDNLISPAAGPVSSVHLHLHLEWLAKGDKDTPVWISVCVYERRRLDRYLECKRTEKLNSNCYI